MINFENILWFKYYISNFKTSKSPESQHKFKDQGYQGVWSAFVEIDQ